MIFFFHNVSGPTKQPEAPPSFGQSFISSTPIKAEAPFKPIVESKVAMPPPPVSAQPSQPISLAPTPQAFPKPAPILPKTAEQPPTPKVAVQKSESGEIRDSFQKVCLYRY